MYTLVKTIARSYDRTIGIREIDVGDRSIRDVITENKEVILVLENTYLTGHHKLNLNDVYGMIYSAPPTLTVNGWLTWVGNTTLPTTSGDVAIREVKAKAMDSFVAGFTTETSTGNYGTDTGDVLDDDKPHLSLVKEGTDYASMCTEVLATVGGYLHLVDGSRLGYYVMDGAVTQQICKSPKVNLISLSNIGSFKLIPLSQCDITARLTTFLKDGLTITTSESLTNKTVWLSIAGYLCCLGRDFQVMSDKGIYLNWDMLNIHKKYMVAKNYIDLSSINAVLTINNDTNVIDKNMLNSDDCILTWMNLSQSFIIVIDNPTVSIDFNRLEDTGLPGKYYIYNDPYKPVIGADGRMPSCSLINEQKAWVLSTSIDAGMTRNFYGSQMNSGDTSLFVSHLMDVKPHHRNALYSMDIKSSIMS